MAARSQFKGFLKLALVSCPVALYGATSDSERTRFNQINPATGNRIKQQLVDAETGDVVERDKLVKGYEVSKGEYVIVTDAELDALAVESTRTIEIERFVPRDQIDACYFGKPYYIAPSDKVGRDAYCCIRDAMAARGVVALGRVVLSKREHPVMIEHYQGGMRVMTLRYPDELRAADSYFSDVEGVETSKELLTLAGEMIDSMIEDFDPTAFVDTYEQGVIELIAAKKAGKAPKKLPEKAANSNVVNLAAALRASVEAEKKTGKAKTKGKPAAAAAKPKGKSKAA